MNIGILIHNYGGPFFVYSGLAKAFSACGHTVYYWNPKEKSAFDFFDETDLNLFIAQTYNINEDIVKCIKERPELKIVLAGADWGEQDEKSRKLGYPVVIAQENEKKILESISSCVSFVFAQYPEKYIDGFMGGWKSIGIRPISFLNAADIILYGKGTKREDLECDISMVGGFWGYKSTNLEKCVLPFCHPVGAYNIKIFGWAQWPVPQYLGPIQNETAKDIFASTKVSLSVSEPHSTTFGHDLVERPHKVLSAGGFCVSDKVDGWREVYSEEELPMPVTDSRQDYIDLVHEFLVNDQKREFVRKNGEIAVYRANTYFHRVAQLFREIGEEKLGEKTMTKYEKEFNPLR